jgi:chromosome partitioning protein
MNILAIANNKGGVGKTTSTQNIGAAIATFTNRKTLLIDLDPQANLSKSFGIYLQSGQSHVGNFLLGETNLNEAIINYKGSNIDILPASIELVDEEDNLRRDRQFPFNLIKALEKNVDEKKYDFILIDCPPALSTFTKIALLACDRYYVPLQAEFFSYEGLREFVNYARKISAMNNRIQLGGVFASRFNPHTKNKFNKDLIEAVKNQLQDKFLSTYIRENIALSKAQAKGEHIFEYDKNSHGAKDYYNLTKEIILK